MSFTTYAVFALAALTLARAQSCVDTRVECPTWKMLGECNLGSATYAYTRQACPLSCGACATLPTVTNQFPQINPMLASRPINPIGSNPLTTPVFTNSVPIVCDGAPTVFNALPVEKFSYAVSVFGSSDMDAVKSYLGPNSLDKKVEKVDIDANATATSVDRKSGHQAVARGMTMNIELSRDELRALLENQSLQGRISMVKCNFIPPTPTPTTVPCVDKMDCSGWKAAGMCAQGDPVFMNENCARACGFCVTTSPTLGENETYAPTMPTAEPTTAPCLDTKTECYIWKATGQCDSNPSVGQMCPLSCGRCATVAPTVEPTLPEPTTEAPTLAEGETAEPTREEPTVEPTRPEPTTEAPTLAEGETSEPTSEEPATRAPTMKDGETAVPTTAEPTAEPTMTPTTVPTTPTDEPTAMPTTTPTTATPPSDATAAPTAAPTATPSTEIEDTDLTVEPTEEPTDKTDVATARTNQPPALVSTPTESGAAQLSLNALLLGAATAALLI